MAGGCSSDVEFVAEFDEEFEDELDVFGTCCEALEE